MNTYGTEISAEYVGRRSDDGWEHHLWNVTLTRKGESITLPYRMGVAHEQTKCGKRKPPVIGRYVVRPSQVCDHVRCENAGWQPAPPGLYDVLCSLKADAVEGRSFHEWAGDYGMDEDSIKARELYFACQESEDRSKRFFGADWSILVEDEEYL